MSTSVAISTAALAASSSNSAAISAARSREQTKQCKEWMPTFDAESSSVEQKQYYAQCVQRVYPENQEMSFGLEVSLKASVLVVIVCIVFFAIRGGSGKDIWDKGVEGIFIGGALGFLFSAASLLVIWIIFGGIFFLIS